MIEPATLEQIIDYIQDESQEVILQSRYNTEALFTVYELKEKELDIPSQIYEADVIGIRIEGNYLILKLDDSYGDIATLLEEYSDLK